MGDFVAEFLDLIEAEPCPDRPIAYIQAAAAYYEIVSTRLGCTAFVVDQGHIKGFVQKFKFSPKSYFR